MKGRIMVFFVSEGCCFTGLFKQRNRNNRAKKPMLKTTGFSFLLSYFIFYKQASPLCIFRQHKKSSAQQHIFKQILIRFL